MGDRCHLAMTIRAKDAPIWNEVFGYGPAVGSYEWADDCSPVEAHPHLMAVHIYEANYGCVDELQSAAEMGAEFFGSHDSGDEYGEGEFFGAGKRLHQTPCLSSTPVVFVDPQTGEPEKRALRRIKAYIRRRNAIIKRMQEEPE